MFTFLSCFMFVTLACNEDCWFQKKTRGAKDLCYGVVRPLTTLLALVLGVVPGVGYACLKHRRALEKEDERPSSVLSSSHSKNLKSIPRKLYQFHDERGKTVSSYRPGGKWCNKCRACYYRKIKTNKRKENQSTSRKQREDESEMCCCTEKKNLQQKLMERHIAELKEMKSFVQTHSPGLWENLLSAIINDRAPLTTNRTDLQQKRMVALLHILAYFRSQKTNTLQKDCRLHPALSGLSMTGLSSGQIFGFSVNPRTVEKYCNEMDTVCSS